MPLMKTATSKAAKPISTSVRVSKEAQERVNEIATKYGMLRVKVIDAAICHLAAMPENARRNALTATGGAA